jgi:signal transduction histidine kinase
MDVLSKDILAYSRISRSELKLARVDVGRLVKNVIDQYVEFQAPRAEITTEGPLFQVYAHEISLSQCVSNLLANAVKFVKPGTEPRIRISAGREAGRVRIWVKDNGIGIAKEHQSRIFNTFERLHTDDEYSGTGIGLALVRRAMEKMGGKCGVESDGKSGSRFWLELTGA